MASTRLLRARELDRAAGPYVLQAAIAACHASARHPADTDWPQIVALYHQLARVDPSPIVQLNRAVAVSYADGPAAALALIDTITGLDSYYPLHSVHAELLVRLGRPDEARDQLEHAARLTRNAREHEVLLARQAAL